jgi:hypothetical protein
MMPALPTPGLPPWRGWLGARAWLSAIFGASVGRLRGIGGTPSAFGGCSWSPPLFQPKSACCPQKSGRPREPFNNRTFSETSLHFGCNSANKNTYAEGRMSAFGGKADVTRGRWECLLLTQSRHWLRTTGAEAEKTLNSIKSTGSIEGDSVLDLEGGGGTVRGQRPFRSIDCCQESVHTGSFDISLCLAALA